MLGFRVKDVHERALAASLATRRLQRDQQASKVGPVIEALRGQGRSWRAIARSLQEGGYPTVRGTRGWSHASTKRLYEHYRKLGAQNE